MMHYLTIIPSGGHFSQPKSLPVTSQSLNLSVQTKKRRRKKIKGEDQVEMYEFSRLSKGDLEEGTLYPGLSYGENALRWGFLRKVYGILSTQILLTTFVSAFTVFYTPINETLKSSPGLVLGVSILPLFCNHLSQNSHFFSVCVVFYSVPGVYVFSFDSFVWVLGIF